MLKSGQFKETEFQIKLAVSMYDILNNYLDKINRNNY